MQILGVQDVVKPHGAAHDHVSVHFRIVKVMDWENFVLGYDTDWIWLRSPRHHTNKVDPGPENGE